jgi:hypothetical protein
MFDIQAMMDRARALRAQGLCPGCEAPVGVGDLRDPISLREYEISGYCQPCQDAVFAPDGEE